MNKMILDKNWRMQIVGENVYGISEEWIEARVPGSVYGNLLEKGLMPDPYDRMNELEALRLMENSFRFQTYFDLSEEQIQSDFILLRFDGIDTLAEVYLNGRLLGKTDNMHRIWEFDIEEEARIGENILCLEFASPTEYIAQENEKVYTGGSGECMKGFPHLRKAHCMFGWDWGPRLPDVGIFREVSVISGEKARLEQVYITQEWNHEKLVNITPTDVDIHTNVVDITSKGSDIHTSSVDIKYDVTVENYVEGEAYEIRTALFDEADNLICEKSSREDEDIAHDKNVEQSGKTYIKQDSGQSDKAYIKQDSGQSDKAYIKQDSGQSDKAHIKQHARQCDEAHAGENTEDGWDTITVQNPKLWWPNGYGKQPLYRAEVTLLDDQGTVLDVWSRRIGLRTMTVNTEQDEWGECFAHEVNGVKIFAMGADYIPEDNILSRVTPERTRKLLQDAAEANYNCIRVWGGGYYPDDWFFDLCDELGLVVWQDFMFACASYELDDDFERNISAEVRDNVRRIRHHACLGLWCGNNEMESQTLDRAWKPSEKQKYDYIKLFEYIIPKILQEEDPVTFYWPSSPSSGGNFDNPWDENRGDTHYWDVWHGNKPFTEFRKFKFRYLSEFGFQSFPCLKTVETFTEPEDRNIFSRVMEMHQRNVAANGKIMTYLSATFLYPADFDTLLYASQLLQADAIRYGIEHFRRHRGRCMGTIVWQLNDIWPVASWASIDYYGRWKALHYVEKRAFAPIMISCEETGELSERPYCVAQPAPIEKSARLHVANETMKPVSGTVTWQLRTAAGEILLVGEERVRVEPLSGTWLGRQDFSAFNELEVYISYALEVEGQVVSEGTCLFTAPKHFAFRDPELSYKREGNSLFISARAYARSVEIQGVDGDVKLSDNFFDMNPGVRRVEILEGDATEFTLRSVYQIR